MDGLEERIKQIERRLDVADTDRSHLYEANESLRISTAEMKKDIGTIKENTDNLGENIDKKMDGLTSAIRWATGVLIALMGIAVPILAKGF